MDGRVRLAHVKATHKRFAARQIAADANPVMDGLANYNRAIPNRRLSTKPRNQGPAGRERCLQGLPLDNLVP
jgi:hypothetical protein